MNKNFERAVDQIYKLNSHEMRTLLVRVGEVLCDSKYEWSDLAEKISRIFENGGVCTSRDE